MKQIRQTTEEANKQGMSRAKKRRGEGRRGKKEDE
jgi:hypothetical protein